MTVSDLTAALAVGPIFGGTVPNAQYGINVVGDVLVNQTADGVDLNTRGVCLRLRDAAVLIPWLRLMSCGPAAPLPEPLTS